MASFGETTELTGAEHIVAAKAVNEAGRAQFQAMFDATRSWSSARKPTIFPESQPTKGNIAGGLTTIEEKALGNVEKLGQEDEVRRLPETGGDAHGQGPVGSWIRRAPRRKL